LYYSALKQLCVSGTRYLLVEFSPDIKFNKPFFAEFEKLIIKFDIIPIIAHAERYKHIQKRVNVIEKFKNLGCIVQINADYIIHNTGEKFVKRLFESGYIDMVASDCHDAEKRRPNLREAIDVINEKYNGYYDRILANKYKFIKQKKD
jgi:protein-tyrosine phosphatase